MAKQSTLLARRQSGLVEDERGDFLTHVIVSAVPDAPSPRPVILLGIEATSQVLAAPSIEGRPRDADLRQHVSDRQR